MIKLTIVFKTDLKFKTLLLEYKKSNKLTREQVDVTSSPETDLYQISVSYGEKSPDASYLVAICEQNQEKHLPLFFYCHLNLRRPSTFFDSFNPMMNRFVSKSNISIQDRKTFDYIIVGFARLLCWIAEKQGIFLHKRNEYYSQPENLQRFSNFWWLLSEKRSSNSSITFEQVWKLIFAFQPLFVSTLHQWASG